MKWREILFFFWFASSGLEQMSSIIDSDTANIVLRAASNKPFSEDFKPSHR